MRHLGAKSLAAPFPYFGGKSGACATVWAALGDPPNYVEPFAGSAAMLLGRPKIGKIETINDADGFVANFWRAVAADPLAVASAADWPVNEVDLFARHMALMRQSAGLLDRLHADPEYYDATAAGWWCWGACAWIGSGWCSGDGPWFIKDGAPSRDGDRGVRRQLPHLSNAGQGVHRQSTHADFIVAWMQALQIRLRRVRVACGDWQRVLTNSVTVQYGVTGVFLDPPYTEGKMQYAAGGVGGALASAARDWCAAHGAHPKLRIVLCGRGGEHDALLDHGWHTRTWRARGGYAKTAGAKAARASETLWCSPHCLPLDRPQPAMLV